MNRFLGTAVLLILSSSLVSGTTTCGSGTLCPEDSPCCSQYGECGVGAYCLGGCDPMNSFSLNSCTPAPVCENKTITFTSMDNLIENTKYLGDASKADFVYSGEPLIYDDQVLLTMPEDSVGTLLASTTYMWYGKASAKLTTSGGQGVVTAFILLSDVKDEIDFEFVGYNLTQAQTNYYWQGALNYDNGGNSSVSSDTMTTNHTYEFDWTPDQITWSIDGDVVRTLLKSDTYNTTSNQYNYPQTPARVQLSLWPAGASTNPVGTIAWAGGAIDWSSSYMTNGYYYAAFSEVTMSCYQTPSGANVTGDKSYVYTDNAGLNSSISLTDDNTILGSFEATGLNQTLGATNSASSAAATSNVPDSSDSGSGSDGQRGASTTTGSGSYTSSSGSASTGFVQGDGASSSSSSSSSAARNLVVNERVLLQGSLFGVVAILAGLFVL